MTKFYVFWGTQTAMANFSLAIFFSLELNAVSVCLAWALPLPVSEQIYRFATFQGDIQIQSLQEVAPLSPSPSSLGSLRNHDGHAKDNVDHIIPTNLVVL